MLNAKPKPATPPNTQSIAPNDKVKAKMWGCGYIGIYIHFIAIQPQIRQYATRKCSGVHIIKTICNRSCFPSPGLARSPPPPFWRWFSAILQMLHNSRKKMTCCRNVLPRTQKCPCLVSARLMPLPCLEPHQKNTPANPSAWISRSNIFIGAKHKNPHPRDFQSSSSVYRPPPLFHGDEGMGHWCSSPCLPSHSTISFSAHRMHKHTHTHQCGGAGGISRV